MILIFGASLDPHVRAVMARLDAAGQAYRCFDLFDPDCDGLAFGVGPSAQTWIGQGFDGTDVRSVWWRLKPPDRIVTDDIVAHYDQQFAFHEWAAVVGQAADRLSSRFWINRREAERLASNKVHQIAVAQRFGLKVPRTLFTNSAQVAGDFLSSVGRCVIKTFLPYLSPDLRQCHARELSRARLDALGGAFGQCPVIVQELVEPDHELRVTVVGRAVFAVRIDARRDRHPDWRLESGDDIFSSVVLEAGVSDLLVALTAGLGLEFGCIDLIRGRDGGLYFLEINPAGQWLWLEERLGLPIASEVARRLAEGR